MTSEPVYLAEIANSKLTQRQPTTRLRRQFDAVKREIGVLLQKTLIIIQQSHRIVRLEAIGFDGVVDLCLEQPHQLDFVPLRHGKNFADRAATDHFFDVPPGFLIGIEENVYLGYSAKQIVQ